VETELGAEGVKPVELVVHICPKSDKGPCSAKSPLIVLCTVRN